MQNFSKMSFAKKIAYFAILTAVTVVLLFVGGNIHLGPVNVNLTLIPLVLCGMILGVRYSAGLGAIIGVVFLIQGITGLEPFTGALFYANPVILTLVCVLKTTFAGAAGSVVYKLLYNKNKYVATFVSAGVVPVVNTGVFVLGMLILKTPLYDFLASAGLDVTGMNPLYVILVIVVTYNFFIEFAVNLIFAPAIYKVIKIIDR